MKRPLFKAPEYDYVPDNCQYYSETLRKWLYPGDKLPYICSGDVFREKIYGAEPNDAEYIYKYNAGPIGDETLAGWSVRVTPLNNRKYGRMRDYIREKPVRVLDETFKDCPFLEEAPVIPETVTSMKGTFAYCTSLKIPPELPHNLSTLEYCFSGCASLEAAPTLPKSVQNITRTFRGCKQLKKPPTIPNSVEFARHTFEQCENLEYAPILPQKLTDMRSMFAGCTKITSAPKLPERVKLMSSAFAHCSSLEQIVDIPATVEEIKYAFYKCNNLRGSATINIKNPETVKEENCKKWLDGVVLPITLTGNIELLLDLAEHSGGIDVEVTSDKS